MDREKIAERLRVIRGGKPRKEVAKAVNISVSALAMYESGERLPRDPIKKRLADYFGLSVEHIFFT